MPLDRFITLPDLRLYLRDWGGDDAEILLFLHGLASTSNMFDLIAPAFSADYHVYAVDQRGHGRSDKPDDGYDFAQIARDIDQLLAVINSQGRPVTVVGHSWGAYTALYYAATRPLRRVILLDGGIRHISDTYATWSEAEIGMAPRRYGNRHRDDIEQMVKQKWLADFYRPELLPLALSVFDTTLPHDVRPHLAFANHMQIARSVWEFQPADFFAQVTCPALIVVAQGKNPFDVAYAQRLAHAGSALPAGKIVVMPDTAHDIAWHRPDELRNIMAEFFSTSP